MDFVLEPGWFVGAPGELQVYSMVPPVVELVLITARVQGLLQKYLTSAKDHFVVAAALEQEALGKWVARDVCLLGAQARVQVADLSNLCDSAGVLVLSSKQGWATGSDFAFSDFALSVSENNVSMSLCVFGDLCGAANSSQDNDTLTNGVTNLRAYQPNIAGSYAVACSTISNELIVPTEERVAAIAEFNAKVRRIVQSDGRSQRLIDLMVAKLYSKIV